MVKGENSTTDQTRKGVGYPTRDREGTEAYSSVDRQGDVPAHDAVEMPTLEECRSRADHGYHTDVGEKLHHSLHYRTKHEREQFEERLRKKSLSQKDIEALHKQLSLDTDDRNVLEETDPIDIDVTGGKVIKGAIP